MDVLLTRKKFFPEGVFGELVSSSGQYLCVTGEHSYDGIPKIPFGGYSCIFGRHQLHSDDPYFETYEVMGVPGHTGLLFHPGNYPQEDSKGCILLGKGLGKTSNYSLMIVDSKRAFKEFMELQNGIKSFMLKVE